MEYMFYLTIAYIVVIILFRLVANTYFIIRLKKDDPQELENLNIKHYPFVSAINITDYVSIGNHLKLKDEKTIKLGNLLKKYYEKAWVFSAVFPLALGVLVVFILFISKT